MLYSEYEKKVTNIAKKCAFVKRNKYPIISTLVVLFTFLFTFLGVSGIIQSDMVLKKDSFTYGEPITYDRAKAFVSSPHYEYAEDISNPTWSSVVPTLVGDYQVRTYTYNGYHVKRYGTTRKFKIVPKSIKLTISNTAITYGDNPFTNASDELVGNDKVDNVSIKYDNLFSPTTNATIDLGSVKIVNEGGVDVTSSYSIETETKNVRILKRAITLSSNYVQREYDGTEIKDNSVSITYGSLASGDYFPNQPTAVGSTMFASTTNRIIPSISELKVYNVNNIDVTSLYSFTYNEGTLSGGRRALRVVGPERSTTYNGQGQRAPTENLDASDLSVSGLASGDRIVDVTYSSPSQSEPIYTGETSIFYTFDIVNSNGVSVKNYYDTSGQIPGKFIINKKDLRVSLTVTNTGSSSMTSSTGSGDIKETYIKEYDGKSINYSTSQSNPDLCQGDTLIGPAGSFTDSGEYTPNPSFTIYNNYTSWKRVNVTDGYNIIYNKAKIVINKKVLKIEVDDLNLYSSSTSLVGNLVGFRITSGSLVEGDNITFVPKRSRSISSISEGTYNLLDYFELNVSNRANYNDSAIITNSPKLTITKSKLNLQINDYSKVYNGSVQEARADYFNNQITIKNNSTKPANISYNNFVISSRLTDVQKHEFDTSDITFSASYIHVANQNGVNKEVTLTLLNGDVLFNLFDNDDNKPYFEITKRVVNVNFRPQVKYYDGNNFDPNLLISNNLYERTGSLANGHTFEFETVRNISSVGVYNSDDLVSAYKLKIVDAYGNDKTSNYDLTYSFTDLEIIKAQIDITLNMSKRISSTRTYKDLFYKTYNDEEVSTFNSSSNDFSLNQYNNEQYYSKNSNITFDYELNVNFGIAPNKNVGTYDVRIDAFTLNITDIYSTRITSKDYVDIQITNGSDAYEIKKKVINFQIPNLTYIKDGKAIDYNFELDTSNISLIGGHSIQITGNEIKEVGSYSQANLNLNFKILDSNGVDVTNNYTLNWTNMSTFRITIEEVRLEITRDIYKQIGGYRRTYDGTAINEADFYSSITSPNVSDDSKHTYTYSIEATGDLPNSYYDAGEYEQTQDDIPSRYSKIYCTKTYSSGEIVKFEVTNVDYQIPSNPPFLVITEKKVLNIYIDDTVYWLGESEYTFDYSERKSSVVVSDGSLVSGDYIKDITVENNNGIVFDNSSDSIEYNVANYQSKFKVTIYNDKRDKDVTSNYDIKITGKIVYKKPTISLTPRSINDVYDGRYKSVGNCDVNADLPFGSTYSVLYNYRLSDGSVVNDLSTYSTKDTGVITYSIASVSVLYKGEDISSYCDINYSSNNVGVHFIDRATIIFNTGNFELGLGFLYDLALPKTYSASMGFSEFNKNFTVKFGFLNDDENGLFTVDSNGYVKVLKEGVTNNQIRDVVIYDSSGEDVTSCFDISWIIGTIRTVDITINS